MRVACNVVARACVVDRGPCIDCDYYACKHQDGETDQHDFSSFHVFLLL
jgi:hypothetical protein